MTTQLRLFGLPWEEVFVFEKDWWMCRRHHNIPGVCLECSALVESGWHYNPHQKQTFCNWHRQADCTWCPQS